MHNNNIHHNNGYYFNTGLTPQSPIPFSNTPLSNISMNSDLLESG